MNRRNLAFGGVAVAAGLAGAAWWKLQSRETPPSAFGESPVVDASTVESFWRLSFDSPDGKSFAMSQFQGKPLLVNFWATWCPPCVEELPLLDYFYQENKAKGWQVVGLAVDQPSAVRTWLQTKPLNFPLGMAGLGGTQLSKVLGNSAGSLPFSVVFASSGKLLHTKVGKVTPEELGQWLILK